MIRESEGPSLAAHSLLLRLLLPTIGTDICVVLSFNLLVAKDVHCFKVSHSFLLLHPFILMQPHTSSTSELVL